MVLNTMGVLGKGTAKQVALGRDVDRQGVNFLGSSIETRFLFGCLKKRMYDKTPEVFEDFLQYYADDAVNLTPKGHGFMGPNGNTFYLCFCGSLGDWPYHVKSGNLTRSFNNVSKQAIPQKNPNGICHECLAGRKNFPWEDFNLLAEWTRTIGGSVEAWNTDGPFLKLCNYVGCRALLYRWDFWHTWNLGVGKGFLASIHVRSLYVLFEGNSIPSRLQALNAHLHKFLHEEVSDEALSFVELTKDKLSWSATSDFPQGRWQKATDTVILHRHAINLLEGAKDKCDKVLSLALGCAKAMDYAISEMHGHGIWIPSEEGTSISTAGIAFLQDHAKLVSVCYELKLNLFMQQPKLHVIAHIFLSLMHQCNAHEFCLNPISMTVPMNEDFIGRISRASRRVSQRLVTKRTAEAYLIQAREAWQKEFIFGK
jgi:hypothetical protein